MTEVPVNKTNRKDREGEVKVNLVIVVQAVCQGARDYVYGGGAKFDKYLFFVDEGTLAGLSSPEILTKAGELFTDPEHGALVSDLCDKTWFEIGCWGIKNGEITPALSPLSHTTSENSPTSPSVV